MLKKNLTIEQKTFISNAVSRYGSTITRKQVFELSKESNLPIQRWLLRLKDYRTKRGTYNLNTIIEADSLL